jgi:hypothetical protein
MKMMKMVNGIQNEACYELRGRIVDFGQRFQSTSFRLQSRTYQK